MQPFNNKKYTNEFLRENCCINFRGYKVYADRDDNLRWADTNKKVLNKEERPCNHCGKLNLIDGDESYDACLGKLPGVEQACCGHGQQEGYLKFENGVTLVLKNKKFEK